MDSPKVLTIQRSKWRRGGASGTYLLASDGMMCCLGFDALACGLPAARIERVAEPYDIVGKDDFEEYAKSPRFFDDDGYVSQSELVHRAIDINDGAYDSEAEREAALIPVLKALGWDDVVFVD